MNHLKTKSIEGQHLQPLVWFQYIYIFFSWTYGQKKFSEELNCFNQYIIFSHEYSIENFPFLDLKQRFQGRKTVTDLHIKPTDCHKYFAFV